MPQLLVRNLDPATKRALEVKAAIHGQSLEAEARQILQAAAEDDTSDTWVDVLLAAVDSVGGVELEIPPRTPSRTLDFGW